MFTIKKKPKTPNIIWDAAAGKPLCKFVKDILTTNDEALAEKLKGMGYEVTGEADQPDNEAPADETPETGNDEVPVNDNETPKSTTGGRKRAAK